MTRRHLAAVLLVIVAALGLSGVGALAAPQPAAAAVSDGGVISGGISTVCNATIVGVVGAISGTDPCKKAGDAVENKVKKEWNSIWNSILGDLIKSAEDVVKWLIKTVITLALLGPSLRLQDTGLFGRNATLAGMLVWLGWVIAAFGLMWQLGKMAVTGQTKHAGQAMVGWVQNAFLTGIGLTIVASLLSLGDAMTSGLVDKTFGNGGDAYKRIVAVMVPATIKNPVMMMCVVLVLLLVGGVQLALIFLRQAAIPIQCLLLPIAGAGRVGGEVTRQWAPRLITSILVAIVYKPLLAVILCAGFAEFGHGQTVTDWLRGTATLLLGILAPGPLMRVFAPIGAEVGGGLAAGGALGAAASVGQLAGGGNSGGGGGSSDGGAEPATAVEQAKHLSQTMPKNYPANDGQTGDAGQDAVAQAARTQGGKVPAQATAEGAPVPAGVGAEAGAGAGAGASTGAAASTGAGAGAAGAAGAGAAAAGPVGLSLVVLDGVNQAVQKGSGQIGDAGNTT